MEGATIRTLTVLLVAALCVIAYLAVRLAAPEIQTASDRICVPLYDQTGMECCQ